MDFIVGFLKTSNKSIIILVVDKISKYAHFYSLLHQFTPTIVTQVFIDHILKLHGMPTSIMSDRDPMFMSKVWQDLLKIQGTQLKMSTSYHPQIDGQKGVVNKCMETYLCCFSYEKKHQRVQWFNLDE